MKLGWIGMAVCAVAVAVAMLLWRDSGATAHEAQHARARALRTQAVQPGGPSGAGMASVPRPSLASTAPRTPSEHAPGSALPSASAMPPGDSDDDLLVTRALIRASLARDLPRKLPALELSDEDLDRLSDAFVRVRGHQGGLRGLAHTRDNAAEIQRLQTELTHDLMIVEEITGMSASELTGALSDEGLTTEEQAHAEPEYRTLPEPLLP